MLESLAVRRAETSTAITRVHEVLDAFAARDHNGDMLTAVRHFPSREAQWADFPAWVTADLTASYAAHARRSVRETRHIIVTNPDMLHTGILPHHTRWTRLFENLRYIVLDELHTYRGVFGSHLCNVLWRLRRIARFYGRDPLFICCSATISNPGELASRLLET